MNWQELETMTLERMAEQPRGFQARLAEHLGVSRSQVGQWVARVRSIPPERIHEVLEMLNLELTVQPSSVATVPSSNAHKEKTL